MPEEVIDDAVVKIQDRGTGLDANIDIIDAAAVGLLAGATSISTYAHRGFNLVEDSGSWYLTAGVAFVVDAGGQSGGQRNNGNPTVKENKDTPFNTELPAETLAVIITPSRVELSLDAGAVNDVYVKFDVTRNNTVAVVYGAAVSEPALPNIHRGQIDESSGSVTQGNEYGDLNARLNTVARRIESFESITVPSNQTMLVSDGFQVDGAVTIEQDGELKVVS